MRCCCVIIISQQQFEESTKQNTKQTQKQDQEQEQQKKKGGVVWLGCFLTRTGTTLRFDSLQTVPVHHPTSTQTKRKGIHADRSVLPTQREAEEEGTRRREDPTTQSRNQAKQPNQKSPHNRKRAFHFQSIGQRHVPICGRHTAIIGG